MLSRREFLLDRLPKLAAALALLGQIELPKADPRPVNLWGESPLVAGVDPAAGDEITGMVITMYDRRNDKWLGLGQPPSSAEIELEWVDASTMDALEKLEVLAGIRHDVPERQIAREDMYSEPNLPG